MTLYTLLLISLLLAAHPLFGNGDALSPEKWPKGNRERAEKQEFYIPVPSQTRSVNSSKAMISATAAPIALEAGLQTLREGGTAADAAIVVALTQVATQAGSVVSYAGILECLYFDASTGKTHSLDATWKSYSGETNYDKIPKMSDLEGPQGRKTLVPGFMAGLGSLHERFGRLEWNRILKPAIWYAENGVPIGYGLQAWFKHRESILTRTLAGKSFFYRDGEIALTQGKRFFQPATAETLRKVAVEGARHMYEGEWAELYVNAVNEAGGKATMEDMESYQAIWQEPLESDYRSHRAFASGKSSEGGYQLLLALNLASAAGVADMPPYWESAKSFYAFHRTSLYSDWLPQRVERHLKEGTEFPLSLSLRHTPKYAEALLEALNPGLPLPREPATDHSASIVVVDEKGNIAALTHTINTASWGSTGMVVGGIPISDSACINAYRFPHLKAGDYVPIGFSPAIIFKGEKPVFAISSIGRGHRRETARIIQSVVGQGLALETVMDAPQWMIPNGSVDNVTIIDGSYRDSFEGELSELGLTTTVIPQQKSLRFNGTSSFIQIDPDSDELKSREDKRLVNFAGGY